MHKKNIFGFIITILIANLLIFIGVANWIIPSSTTRPAIEDISGLITQSLGGQSKTYTGDGLLPDDKDGVLAGKEYSVFYQTGLGAWLEGGPSQVGTHQIKYTIDGKDYFVLFTINSASATYVAYRNTNEDGNKFTSIKAALESANDGDIIWVIPGTNPIIDADCAIKPGVSLYIPYGIPNNNILAGEDSSRIHTKVHANIGPGSTPPSHTNEKTYLKNNVIIASGVTLTNNGTIKIGGVLDGGYMAKYSGLNASGHTDTGDNNSAAYIPGDYGQITLNSKSKIISNGIIECYGYIIDNYSETSASVISENKPQILIEGGTMSLPFIVAENRQGSRFANFAGGIMKYAMGALGSGTIKLSFDSVPFNRFYVQNIACRISIKYGSSIIGIANMYANNQDNPTDVNMIGTTNSYLICMNSTSYIECESVINRDATIGNGASKITMNIFGGGTVNSLSLFITADFPVVGTKTIQVSAEGTLLGLCWYFDINLYPNDKEGNGSASYTFSQDLKLMPGASLTVHEGVTLTATRLMVYNGNNYSEKAIYESLYGGKNITSNNYGNNIYLFDIGSPDYYNVTEPAHLIVNGTLNVSSLGGLVETTNTGAVLKFTTNNVSSLEIISIGELTDNGDGTYTYVQPDASKGTTKKTDCGSKVKLYTVSNKNNPEEASAGTYYSKDGYWDTTSTFNTFTINYETYGIGSEVSTTTYKSSSTTHILTTSDLPVLSAYYYNFLGWYDSNGRKYIVGNSINSGSIILYAKWEAIEYNIDYYIGDEFVQSETFTFNDLISSDENKKTLYAPIKENMVFDGWYYTSDLAGVPFSDIKVSDVSILFEYMLNGNVSLYGEFIEPLEKNITFNFVIENSSDEKVLDKSNNVIINANQTISNLSTTVTTESTTVSLVLSTCDTIKNYNNSYNNDSSYRHYFVGWYLDNNYSNQWTGSASLNEVENYTITLYAKYVDKVCIKYNNKEMYLFNTSDAKFTLDDDNTTGDDKSVWTYNDKPIVEGTAYTLSDYNNYIVDNTISFGSSSIYHKFSYSISASGTDTSISFTLTPSETYYNLSFSVEKPSISPGTSYYIKTGSKITITYTNPANGNEFSSKPTYKFNGSTFTSNNTSLTASGSMVISYKTKESGGCITSDTLITLFDGSQKRIDQMTGDEIILVWNHEAGKFEGAKISTFVKHNEIEEYMQIYELQFSNGSILKLIGVHTIYDATINQYILVDPTNIYDYIGHEFVFNNNMNIEKVVLTEVNTYYEYTRAWNLISHGSMNSFANNILHSHAYSDAFLNAFDIDSETLKYVNVQEDIDKYGYSSYDDYKEYLTQYEFDIFNIKNINIALQKRKITEEYINEIFAVLHYYKEQGHVYYPNNEKDNH